jgi:hypothetical protein
MAADEQRLAILAASCSIELQDGESHLENLQEIRIQEISDHALTQRRKALGPRQ